MKANRNGTWNIHRGVCSDSLENMMELLIGGSMFRDELSIKLILDFEVFDEELTKFKSKIKVSDAYISNRSSYVEWLTKRNIKIDPYLFFVTNVVQYKVQKLLKFNLKNPPDYYERVSKFKKNEAKLTDLIGFAGCAELASLGQYLLQNVLEDGYYSYYMGGVTTGSPSEDLSYHSFIVMRDLKETTYIFDIARPIEGVNVPRILRTDVPFDCELFNNKKNLLVGTTDIIESIRLYYGVGTPLLEQKLVIIDTNPIKQ